MQSGRLSSDNPRFKFDNSIRPPPSEDGISSATFETIYPQDTLHMYPQQKREPPLLYPNQIDSRGKHDYIDRTHPYSPPEIPMPVRAGAVNLKEALLPPTPPMATKPRRSHEQERPNALNTYEKAGALPLPSIVVDSPRRLVTEPIPNQYNSTALPGPQVAQAKGVPLNRPVTPPLAPGAAAAPPTIGPGQTVLVPNGQGAFQTAIVDANGQVHPVATAVPNNAFNAAPNVQASPRRGYYDSGAKKLNSDKQSVLLFRQNLEHELVTTVMNTPLIRFKARGVYRDAPPDSHVTITVNFVVYLFEIICGIVLITLSLLLVGRDSDVHDGIYKYMIADSVVSLCVALLFVTRIINFERRNGSFYCTIATIMKLVLFIMVTSTVIPAGCSSAQTCRLRKAVSAFTIVSTFLWEGDLVMFLTTVYISRLNLLNDINFDYSNRGINKAFNEPEKVHPDALVPEPTPQQEFQPAKGQLERLFNPATGMPEDYINPMTGEPLKEFILNQDGHLLEIAPGTDMSDTYMFIVYPL